MMQKERTASTKRMPRRASANTQTPELDLVPMESIGGRWRICAKGALIERTRILASWHFHVEMVVEFGCNLPEMEKLKCLI